MRVSDTPDMFVFLDWSMKSKCDITSVNACISCFLGIGMKMNNTVTVTLLVILIVCRQYCENTFNSCCLRVSETDFGNKCCDSVSRSIIGHV